MQNTHGGKRAGAGRPKGSTSTGALKTGRIVISCLQSDVELVKSLAQKQNKTVSAYLIDLVKMQND